MRRALADAGIECHLQSSHLRTLLALFGPCGPIDVLVPAAAAEEARARIEPLFQDMIAEPRDDSVAGALERALRAAAAELSPRAPGRRHGAHAPMTGMRARQVAPAPSA